MTLGSLYSPLRHLSRVSGIVLLFVKSVRTVQHVRQLIV